MAKSEPALPVIYRIEQDEHGRNVVAFLPHCEANIGFIVCYAHTGQHSEAQLSYYQSTKPVCASDFNEVNALRRELISVGYKLIAKKRLPVGWRDHAWKSNAS